MTLDELKIKVDERNKKISVPYEVDPGLDYCKKVLDNNEYSSIEKFLNSNIYDACKCIYYISNKGKKSIEESCRFIDSVSEYFKSLSETEFRLFYDMLFYLASYEIVDEIFEYLEEDDYDNADELLRSFNFVDPNSSLSMEDQERKNNDHYILLMELRRINKNECNIVGLLKEAFENGENLSLILGIILIQKRMQLEKEEFLDTIERRYSIKRGTSASKKHLRDYFKNIYKTKNIIGDIDIISEFVTQEEYGRYNHEKQVQKEIKANEQAFNVISKESQNDEIKEARTLVKKIKDEELKNMFLRFIYEHNKKYYNDLDERLEETRENSSAKYLDELSKYRIILDASEVHELMNNSLADFREMLIIINKYILGENGIIRILKTSNLERVKKIDNYVKEGILSISFVENRIDIFDTNVGVIDIVDRNVNLLASNGINPKLFINSLDILLYDGGDELVNNIKVLDDYQIKGSLKTTDNYLFLLDDKLTMKIDRLIELGYINYLEADLNILNSKNLDRLEVLKAINLPVTDIDELRDVLNKDKFIISDDLLGEYIPNILVYKDKINISCSLNELEKYRIDDRTYRINGILISSNKVKRLLSEGHDLYDSIFYNTLLSLDEYQEISEEIKQYSYKI